MPGCNGAALWYDGFSREPGRLLLALLGSAAGAGASLANYCVAEELVMAGGGVSGAVVRDLLSGEVRTLRAGCVLNATGPWVDELTQMAGRSSATRLFHPSRAFNLVVPRLPFDMAIGIPAPRAAATYFIVPWGARSLIGTRHLPLQDSAGCMRIEAHEVAAFLEEINPALGPHRLSSADVLAVKAGLLPEEPGALHPPLRLQRHARIVDHATEDGIAGLVSIVGVKWTTARLVAQQTVQRVCDKLQRRDLPSAGAHRMYALADSDPVPDVPFLADCAAGEATLVRAAREEMAVHLADAVMRRTDLWLSRALGREALERAATAMAAVHGWSALQIAAEVEDTQAALARQRPGGDAGTRSGRAMRAGKEGFT
jgi:glycerol-3-phosphate dehydrogenase